MVIKLKRSIRKNPYSLLALFLSPWKNPATISLLCNLISDKKVDWAPLLYQANLNLVTPLWYERLKQDNILRLLPDELQEYLCNLYQLNIERNQIFIHAIEEILGVFQKTDIDSIILKGGASFFDDLYKTPGARIVQDIDILIEINHVDKVKEILSGLGFQEVPDPGKVKDGLPTDERHHHVELYNKPGTPVGIEVHYKLSYGSANRVLTAEEVWKRKRQVSLGTISTFIPSPTHRVLHNTVHALLPKCELILSQVSLMQLAEFSYLSEKYPDEINWLDWLESGKKAGMTTPLLAYIETANQLMMMPIDPVLKRSLRAKYHTARIVIAGKYIPEYPEIKYTTREQFLKFLVVPLIEAYYYIHLPVWIWQNVCYAKGIKNFPVRIKYMFKKISSKESRKKSWF